MDVEILMATYNGEKYVAQQIESVLKQTYKNWHLIIKDDCSVDNTYNILKDYANKYPEKITLIKSEKNSGSAKENFFSMLRLTRAPYIMFCDQDDYWLENKIEVSISSMKKNEEENLPVLVHTDLKVADDKLEIISPSMFKMQRLDFTKNKPNNMVVQNIVTGCTVMINRKFLELLDYTPKSVNVHDWWIGLVAAVFGKIVFINEPTILYRQHGKNVCGAKNMSDVNYLSERAYDRKGASAMLELGYNMSGEFALNFRDRLDEAVYTMLMQYSNMKQYNKLKRLATVFKYGIWKTGPVRKIGQILYM